MHFFRKIIIRFLLLSSLAGVYNVACALSLGELKVYSYLNEPLSAEIVIDGVENLNASNIIAELASDKDFERTGIPKSFLLNRLKFEVVRNNDITVVHISTSKAVKETYLDFLLQVTWPEGKIIKNYTILLDPAGVNTPKREVPLNKQKKSQSEGKPSKASFSNAIFATSLEDSMENEISLEQKKEIANMADEVISAAPPVTQEVDIYEASSVKEQNKINNNGVLDKVAASLQVFAQQPYRNNVDYEKLLDLKPSPSILGKHEIPIAENLAISQINAELKELRKRDQPSNSDNSIVSTANNNIHTEQLANTHLELMKKYGNDLLLAFFLVSGTIFLFYKIVPVTHKNDKQQNNTAIVTKPETPIEMVVQPPVVAKAIKTVEPPLSFSPFSKNEELELKLDLAKQYIDAGDKYSAKDILQDLNNSTIQEPRYKDKLDSLLRCIV